MASVHSSGGERQRVRRDPTPGATNSERAFLMGGSTAKGTATKKPLPRRVPCLHSHMSAWTRVWTKLDALEKIESFGIGFPTV